MGHRGIAATSPCGYSQRAAEPSSGAIRVRRPHGPVRVAATSGWRCPREAAVIRVHEPPASWRLATGNHGAGTGSLAGRGNLKCRPVGG